MNSAALSIQKDKYRKILPVVAFMAGLLWDTLTLNRIDTIFDNIIMMLYILLYITTMVVANFIDKGLIKNVYLVTFKDFYPLAMQFLVGSLFSGYTVFYFKSSSFANISMFFLFISSILIANEFLQKKYSNIYMQFTFLYLVNLTFFVFFIPVVLSSFGLHTFIIAGIVSIVIVEIIAYIFQLYEIYGHYREQVFAKIAPVFLFVLFLVFYLNNLIPPVPLAIKYSGVYHNVEKKNDNGNLEYELSFIKPTNFEFFKSSDNSIYLGDGDKVFCFASVFAPTKLETTIYHKWQKYDNNTEEWVLVDKIDCKITGGRDNGYRGMSFKSKAKPGIWRVDISTESDQILGRINFEIFEKNDTVLEFVNIIR